jgi:hypothetical protein
VPEPSFGNTPSDTDCKLCGNVVTTAEKAAYGERCENCYTKPRAYDAVSMLRVSRTSPGYITGEKRRKPKHEHFDVE